MPVAPEIGGVQGHDDEMARSSPDLLVAARTDVLLASLERLDTPKLGRRAGEGILDEGHGPVRRRVGARAGAAPAGAAAGIEGSPGPARDRATGTVCGMGSGRASGALAAFSGRYHEA